MSDTLSPADAAKRVAALRACDYVETGMRLGLGTGSTAAWLVKALGAMVRNDGLEITAVATSTRTAEQARSEGITIVPLDEAGWLDLTIDGADEFDPEFHLIKGGGGALLQEKIVAMASDRMIVIADPTKDVATLGAFPLPIEVIPFGWETSKTLVEELITGLDVVGDKVSRRMSGADPFVTDEGNFILDLHLGRIGNPRQLALVINQIPGVVENGLFIDICDTVIVGHPDGTAVVRDINDGSVTESRVSLGETPNIFTDIAE